MAEITSDLLSRLAAAQIEASAKGWYGLDVLLYEAEMAIQRLVAERDEARRAEKALSDELDIREDEGAQVDNEITKADARATAAEAEVERLTAENAELKAWKKRRQEEDEDEADRREIW